MRNRLAQLIHDAHMAIADREDSRDTYTAIADYLLENGVIVPLVKVGETVYRVCKKKYDVDGYGMQWEEDMGIVTNAFHLGMLHEIGKTVFLTREAAEAALKAREKE